MVIRRKSSGPVVKRLPAPDVPGRPLCFGFSHRAELPGCQRCPFAGECSTSTAEWAGRSSLMQDLQRAELQLLTRPKGTHALYRELYNEHFGTWPSDADVYGKEMANAFRWVEQTCAIEGIDIADFMTAQMYGMRKFLEKNPDIGFKPTMMAGANAMHRWRIGAWLGTKHRRGTSHVAVAEQTTLHLFLRDLAAEEEKVLRLYTNGVCWGSTDSVRDVISAVGPSDTWLAVMGFAGVLSEMKAGFAALSAYLHRLPVIKTVAMLRGAVAVAADYRHGLAARMRVTGPYRREHFARFIGRLYPARPCVAVPIDPHLGVSWP